MVKKLVMLDVGMMDTMTTQETIVRMFYQLWFACAYIIGQVFSKLLAFYFYKLMYWSIFTPIRIVDKPPAHFKESIRIVDMFYPYYYLWKRFFTDQMDVFNLDFPKCSLLYMVSPFSPFALLPCF